MFGYFANVILTNIKKKHILKYLYFYCICHVCHILFIFGWVDINIPTDIFWRAELFNEQICSWIRRRYVRSGHQTIMNWERRSVIG